jgi:hypothetical protein
MSGLEKKLWERKRRFGYRIDITSHDDNARYLIGWPGYRTARNKSGLGYIDSHAELAHVRGLMIRWLFTGKFRTYNPFYLFGMGVFGMLAGGMPAIFILYEIIVNGNWSFLRMPIVILPYFLIGLLLLVNMGLSLIYWKKDTSITGDY